MMAAICQGYIDGTYADATSQSKHHAYMLKIIAYMNSKRQNLFLKYHNHKQIYKQLSKTRKNEKGNIFISTKGYSKKGAQAFSICQLTSFQNVL